MYGGLEICVLMMVVCLESSVLGRGGSLLTSYSVWRRQTRRSLIREALGGRRAVLCRGSAGEGCQAGSQGAPVWMFHL